MSKRWPEGDHHGVLGIRCWGGLFLHVESNTAWGGSKTEKLKWGRRENNVGGQTSKKKNREK